MDTPLIAFTSAQWAALIDTRRAIAAVERESTAALLAGNIELALLMQAEANLARAAIQARVEEVGL
jgi:hypothetical protein